MDFFHDPFSSPCKMSFVQESFQTFTVQPFGLTFQEGAGLFVKAPRGAKCMWFVKALIIPCQNIIFFKKSGVSRTRFEKKHDEKNSDRTCCFSLQRFMIFCLSTATPKLPASPFLGLGQSLMVTVPGQLGGFAWLLCWIFAWRRETNCWWMAFLVAASGVHV